jgi:SAM-dependent methyltransferase
MEHLDVVPRYLHGPGVEIGAFKSPIPGIKPTYVDRFGEYAGERTLADYYGDACDLPFHDNSLQYVASSHVLEHVANPLAALKEWHRVLGHGGIIYMVVPDRRKTFDRHRDVTPVSHLLDDFRRQTTQCDPTHIDDFVSKIEFTEFWPNTPRELESAKRAELAGNYRHAVQHGLEINIHFHVFEPATVLELLHAGNRDGVWRGRIVPVEVHENFPGSLPNGFLIVARVEKPWTSRLRGARARTGLRADARPFGTNAK